MVNRRTTGLLPFAASLLMAGCSIHYYDVKTNTENVIGFARVQLRHFAAPEDVPVSTRTVESLGLALVSLTNTAGISLGYQIRSETFVGTNVNVLLIRDSKTGPVRHATTNSSIIQRTLEQAK